MSQKDDILAVLAVGPATMAGIGRATGIKTGTLQAQLSELKRTGRAKCDGIGPRDPWRLPGPTQIAAAAPDDPTMIPGGPLPACEIAAETETAFAAADFAEPDDETPTARAVALAVVAAAQSLGEDPTQIAVAGTWLRCRFAAVKALAVYYDGCSWEQLGRFVGFVKLTQKAVDGAMNFPWWEDVGDPAFEAAVSALEAA